MFALRTATDELIARATGSGDVKQLDQASNAVMGQLESASVKGLNDTLHRLAQILPTVHPLPAGAVAITCGAVVESGGDPNICGEVVLGRLPDILRGTVRFHETCRERAEADGTLRPTGESEEENEEGEVEEPSEEQLAEKYIQAVHQDDPDAVFAYLAERPVRLSAIAHLGRSKPLRAVARSRPQLLDGSEKLDAVFAAGRGFLTKMLLVLDDEPLVVLHPSQSKGFHITLSGVPINFALHEQLMAHLIGDPTDGWVEAKGFDLKRALAVASGATVGGGVSGLFNLWNWTGVRPDGTLPEGTGGADDWIWNEGVPADIRPFEGTRVVVLGPPPYSRSWNVGRTFDGLEPEVRVDEKLPAEVVADWLRRLGQAPKG